MRPMTESDLNILFFLIFIVVFAVLGLFYKWVEMQDKTQALLDKSESGKYFFLLLTTAIMIRVLFAGAIKGFPSDIACFQAWSEAAAADFFHLYHTDMFIDYPPAYMYILYLIGSIGELFHIQSTEMLYIILLKIPAMFADILSGVILYGILKDSVSQRKRLLITAFYWFNPVVFFLSTIWGQIDSIMALLILAAILCFVQKKYWIAGVVYAFAVLIKPQGIIFLPIPFFVLLYQIIFKREWKPLIQMMITAIGTIITVVFPFSAAKNNPLWIIELYFNTLEGYDYASVNAFNFFSLLGGNWKSDSEMLLFLTYADWGMLAIVLFSILTGVYIFFHYRRIDMPEEQNRSKDVKISEKGILIRENTRESETMIVNLTGAFLLLLGVVTFGHRMHERYFFPALLLLLAAYSLSQNKLVLATYGVLSFAGFLNIVMIFSAYYTDAASDFYNGFGIYFISALDVACVAVIWFYFLYQTKQTGRKTLRLHSNSIRVVLIVTAGLLAGTLGLSSQNSIPVYATDSYVAVNNPGFEIQREAENEIAGWETYDYKLRYEARTDISTISYDTEFYNSGMASIRLESTKKNDLRVHQIIPVEPGSIYKISAYVMTDSVAEDSGIGANISVMDLLVVSEDIKGSYGDFKEIALYGITEETQTELDVSFGLGGYGNESMGTVWFDDISVEKLSQVPPEIFLQPLYETDDFYISENQDKGEQSGVPPNTMSPFVRYLFITIIVWILIGVIKIAVQGSVPEKLKNAFLVQEKLDGIDRKDIIVMAAMTVVYLMIALFRLGGFDAPQTSWKSTEETDSIVFDFGEPVQISRVLFNGNTVQNSEYESCYLLEIFDEETGEYESLCQLADSAFYEWKYESIESPIVSRFLRMTAINPGMSLNEIAFFSGVQTHQPLAVTIAQDNTEKNSFGVVANLIDEQKIVPYQPNVLNSTYFDEVYFPRTAYEHIHRLPIYETTHPPMGKLIIAIGILLFGMNPFGWRIMGTLAGAAMIPVMYLFGKKLFRHRFYAFCAAFLMMFDFMHFAQTRLSTIDSYATLAIILMYYFMYDSFMKGIDGNRKLRDVLLPLLFCGLAFGFGASSKWIVLYAGLGVAFLFFLARIIEMRKCLQRNEKSRDKKSQNSYWRRLWIVLGCCVIFFIVLPGVIYLLSYIPYTKVPGASGGLLKTAVENQREMLDYHSTLKDTHPFESAWWSWPIMVKPIWYYSGVDLAYGMKSGISSFGNPLIWWLGIPCTIAAFYSAYQKRDKKMSLLFVAFIFQYCPWILISRATFIYHYFSSVPFMILMIVYTMKNLMESHVISKRAVYGYFAAVLVLFALYYPVLTGLPVKTGYSNALRIFSSWIW